VTCTRSVFIYACLLQFVSPFLPASCPTGGCTVLNTPGGRRLYWFLAHCGLISLFFKKWANTETQTKVAVFTRMQFIVGTFLSRPEIMSYRKLDYRNGQQTFDKIILCTLFKVYVHICCSSWTIRRFWHRTLQRTEHFLLTLHLGTAVSNYVHCGDR